MNEQFSELTRHPYSECLPRMNAETYNDLVEDIGKHGQHDPIVTHEGKILDGYWRFQACRELGIEPKIVPFEEVCPSVGEAKTEEEKKLIAIEFVFSRNINRRDLDKSQRAMLMVEFATLGVGQAKSKVSASEKVLTQKEAADKASVSTKLIYFAKVVKNEAPNRVPDIIAGLTTASAEYDKLDRAKTKRSKRQKEDEQNLSRFDKAVSNGAFTGKAFQAWDIERKCILCGNEFALCFSNVSLAMRFRNSRLVNLNLSLMDPLHCRRRLSAV